MLTVDIVATTQEKIIDISSVTEQCQLTFELEGNAGSMELSYLPKQRVDLEKGDVVTLKVDGTTMFYGWIFKKDISAYGSVKLKIYDIKRYLAYKDVDITGNETVDQFFTRICTVMNVKHQVVHTSSFIIPTKIHDGETYNNMLQYALDQTFIGTDGQQRFCVRANGDTLELVDCKQQLTDVLIGDKCLMTDFQFSSDIEDTYTIFKVQREVASESDKKKKKESGLTETQKVLLRTTKVAKHEENLKKWGSLQYYEKKDSKWTDAQLNDYLKHVAVVKSRETKSLKISALGNVKCIPGNIITLDIKDVTDEGVVSTDFKFALIVHATHTVSNNLHTMELEVEVM